METVVCEHAVFVDGESVCLVFCLCWLPYVAILVDGQNIAATSSGVAIGTNGGNNGLVVSTPIGGERRQLQITKFGGGVSIFSSFDDIAIDPINESLVFALSTASMTVCSFLLDGTTADENSILQLVGCVGIFSTLPFCGVSAYGGTLMISGGSGGFTIYEYDQQSGTITDTPTVLNQLYPNIVGHRVLDDAKATKAQGYQQRRGDMRESYYAFVPRRVRETRPASRRHPTDGEAFSEL